MDMPAFDLSAILLGFASQYPIISTIVFIVGIARLVNKPLFAIAHSVVDATESESDNIVLDKVEKSAAYKAFSFVLDYVGSIKISKPKK